MERTWIRTRWNELQGAMQTRWDRLSQADLDTINGSWDLLVWTLQERYNASRAQAENEIDRFLETINSNTSADVLQ